MAEQDIISIGYDPAFATQNKEVYDQVLQTYNLLKQMDGLKVGTGGAGYADLKAQAAGLQKQIEQLTAANIKLTQAIADGQVAVKQKTKTEKEAEKAARDESKAVAELANTYKQYSLAARDASIKAKSYALELGAKHPLTIQATKDALEMNTRLKELDATTGIYNRNVGNYSSVLTGYANTLRGLRGPTKLLGEAFGFSASEADQFRLIIEHVAQALAVFFRSREAGAKVAATASGISVAASKAESAASLVSADSVRTAASATSLAINSEKLYITSKGIATAVVKDNTVSKVNNTAASIVNSTANDKNATSTTAVTVAVGGSTAAFNTATVAETGLAVATTATSTAMKVLRVALFSLGILTIIAGVALLAYQLYKVATAVSEAEKNQKLYNDAIKEAGKSAASEVAHLVAIREKLNDLKTPQADRVKYINDYNKVADEGNKIDAKQIDNLDLINKKINEQILLIEKRALAKAAENALSKQAEKVIAAQLEVERYKEYADGKAFQELMKKQRDQEAKNNKDNQQNNSDALANRQNYAKSYSLANSDIIGGQKKYISAKKTLDKEQAELDRLASVLSPLFGPDKADIDKISATNLQQLKERTNALFQLYKSNQQELIKVNDEAAKNEKNSFEERLTALSDFYYNTDELNRAEKLNAEDNAKSKAAVSILHLREELKEGKKTAAEKSRINENIKIEQDNLVQDLLVITQKYNQSKTYLDADLSKITSDLIDKEFEKRKKAGHDELEEYKKLQILKNQILKDSASNDIGKQELLLRMQFELDIKKKNAGEIKIIEDKLQKDIDNIHRKGALVQLQLDLNELERKKTLLALFGFNTMAIEKQITENQNQQAKIRAQITTQEAQDRLETEQQVYSAMQTFTEDATKTIELIGKLMNITYEKQLNAIQKLIDANNKKQSNELKGIENSTVSEQEKAAMIIQLNARTASKNMELEEEQRQIKIKQAKFDKDAAIAKIILNGAIAFTSALSIPIYGEIQAAIIAGLTAAEIAIAIATPIPTYAEGGTHPGGYAIYGEAGLESVKEPGKAPYLVDSPTMGILPAGTVLTPLKGMINDSMQNSFMNSFENVMVMAQLDSGLKEIKEAIIEQGWHTQQAIRQQKRGGTNIILNGDFGRYLQKTVIN